MRPPPGLRDVSSVPEFKSLTPAQHLLLATRMREVEYQRGDLLERKGSSCDRLQLILYGTVVLAAGEQGGDFREGGGGAAGESAGEGVRPTVSNRKLLAGGDSLGRGALDTGLSFVGTDAVAMTKVCCLTLDRASILSVLTETDQAKQALPPSSTPRTPPARLGRLGRYPAAGGGAPHLPLL